MNPAVEKFLGFLLAMAIFVVGGGAIYFLSHSEAPKTKVIHIDDEGEETLHAPEPIQFKSAPAEPSHTPQPLKIEAPNALQKPQSNDNRYPSNLPKNQVYFEVIEGGYAITQGDILMGQVPSDKKGIENGISQPKKTLLWPSNIIPYTITGEITNTQPIVEAIDYFNDNTSVRFVPAEEGDQSFLVFVAIENHCASHLGRTGGPQPVLISPKCGKTEVMHELMHALGFVHEHSRQDRDNYIDILWENIQPQFLFQFNKMPDQMVHNYSGSVFEFDSESIMLYPDNAFAKLQGQKTMRSKGRRAIHPSRDELSRVDKERLYYLYGR